jgi:protein required for attachment to host cells
MNTWIVCANRSGLKIFACSDMRKGVHSVAHYPHPEGRLKEHDLVSDHGGTKGGTKGDASSLHGTNPRESAKDHVAEQFAQFVSQEIDKALDAKSFDAVILCADPHFLGRLNKKISKRAEKFVIGSLSENLYNSSTDLIFHNVKEIISGTLIPPSEIA